MTSPAAVTTRTEVPPEQVARDVSADQGCRCGQCGESTAAQGHAGDVWSTPRAVATTVTKVL